MLQLETSRTFLRPINVEDAEVFYALNLDPDVVRYTGDGPFESVEHARAFLAVYDQYEKYGVGRFAVIEKSTSKCLGWCGLKYHPEEEVYDLGYRFFKSYWNQGFASETAAKWLEYGFHELHLPRIVAHAMKANTASIRVFEKIGMQYLQDITLHGSEAVLYEKKAEV
jgi:[ribosomal protein S5]-alanine N-acetyltransferase